MSINLDDFANNLMQTTGIKEQTTRQEPKYPRSKPYVKPDVTASYYTDTAFHVIDSDLAEAYEELVADIAKYSMLTENVHDLHDETQRINLFAKLSYGLRKSGEAKAWVSFHYNLARSEKKASEGIAALDEFPTYLTEQSAAGNELKATDKNREWFLMQNQNVLTANKKVAMLEAMDEVISIYKMQFTQGISTIKAMVYGNRDSSMLSGSDNTNRL